MQIQLSLSGFFPDESTIAFFHVHSGNELVGHVQIGFNAGPNEDQHVFDINLPNLPHYVQAKIIYEASMMLDSHFAPDSRDPEVEKTFEA